MTDAREGVSRFAQMLVPEPKWFVLVGVGKGYEVPRIRELWPECKLVCAEPLPFHCRKLLRQQIVTRDELHEVAVWSKNGTVELHCNYEFDARASLYSILSPLPNETILNVRSMTLDSLERETGPWKDAILWIDAEGSEYEIINASNVLTTEKVKWINVEVSWCNCRDFPPYHKIDEALRDKGFEQWGVHGLSRNGRQGDAIYVRREEWTAKRMEVAERSVKDKIERLEQLRRRKGRTGRILSSTEK